MIEIFGALGVMEGTTDLEYLFCNGGEIPEAALSCLRTDSDFAPNESGVNAKYDSLQWGNCNVVSN